MTGRAFLGTSVVLAWAAGMGLMAQRELNRSPSQLLAEAAVGIAPDAEFYAIRDASSNEQVGFSSMTVDTVEQGLQFTSYLVTSDGELASRSRVTTQTITRTSRGLGFRSATFRRSSLGSVTARHAELRDSVLLIVTGADTARRIVREPILTPAMLPAAVGLGSTPDVGASLRYVVYSPDAATLGVWHLTVRAESIFVVTDSAKFDSTAGRWSSAHVDSVHAWRIVSSDGSYDTWITKRGQQVRVHNGDTRWERTAYEIAFENWRARSAGMEEPREHGAAVQLGPALNAARYVIQGLDLRSLAVAAPHQTLSGDTVTVTRWHSSPASPEFWLPLHWRHRQKYASLLRVEPQVNPQDPLIIAVALRVRGRENDPRRVAQYLAQWVADSIADSPDVAPDASTTVRSRAGTDAGRLHLFVALARAADIPTQIVSGVVINGPQQHFHVWAECYYGGWIAVDPAFGQFPADARHLRLTIANEAVRDDVMRLVDRARWHVVSTTLSQNH